MRRIPCDAHAPSLGCSSCQPLGKRTQGTKHLAQEYQTPDNVKRHTRRHVTKHQIPKTRYQGPENMRPITRDHFPLHTDTVGHSASIGIQRVGGSKQFISTTHTRWTRPSERSRDGEMCKPLCNCDSQQQCQVAGEAHHPVGLTTCNRASENMSLGKRKQDIKHFAHEH